MSKLLSIITQFTDREFAYFLKFRLPEFSDYSKEIIYKEFKQRKLTKNVLNQIVNENFNPEPGNCIKCNSNSFFIETRIEQTGNRYEPEKEIHTNRCIVCGYNDELESQLNSTGFMGWITKLFSA